MASGSVVFTKMPIALMLAIDAIEERVVRDAVDRPLDVEAIVAASLVARRHGVGLVQRGRSGRPFGFFVSAIVGILGLPSARSLHAQRASVDPVVAVVRPALYLEARIAHEQAEEIVYVPGVKFGSSLNSWSSARRSPGSHRDMGYLPFIGL